MKYGSKILILFILFSFASCAQKSSNSLSSTGNAEQGMETKIGFVDRKVVESKMVALKNLEKSFLKEEGKIRNELIAKKNKLEERYKSLEKSKNEGILDRKALEVKAKDIEKDFFELQQSEREAGELMNFVKMQIAFEISQKIQESAREVGDKNKYFLILTDTSVFYLDNSRVDDLTFDVIASVNNNFKKLDIEKYFQEAKKALEKMKKSAGK